MRQSSTQWLYPLIWTLAVIILQACAPLTAGGNGSTANCIAAILGNSVGVGLGQTGAPIPGGFLNATTMQLAESFLANSATPISTVSLNLDTVAPSGIKVNGQIFLDIEADGSISTTTPTPTVPNGISLGSATLSDTSTIPTQAQGATFIPFDFSEAPVTLTPGLIYWIVATPGYAISATNYIEWRAASTTIRYSLSDYFFNSWQLFSNSVNLNFKVGC